MASCQESGMYAAPVISGGALLGPTNAVTSHTGTLPSQLAMNRNRATGVMYILSLCMHNTRNTW